MTLKGANAFLKDKIGTPYEENPDLKKLHTSMFADKPNTYARKYAFQLINNKKKKILIAAYSLKTKKLIDYSCGYTYADIEKVLTKKLKSLFYVSAETKQITKGKNRSSFTRLIFMKSLLCVIF